MAYRNCLAVLMLLLCVLQWEAKPDELEPARRCFVFEEDSAWACSVFFRADASEPRLDGSLPAPAVATRSAILNWNFFGKRNISEKLRLSLDTDVYTQRDWRSQSRNVLTSEVNTERGTFANARSETHLGLNEIFVSFESTPAWQMSVGKKRLIWGTGFASNPTDVLNPGKNLLDPTTEKRGSWLILIENLHDDATFSFVAAPGVIENHNTIPTKIYSYKTASTLAEENHYLYGFRSYHLIGEADLNLMLFKSLRYKDEVSHQVKGGVSWSQSFASMSEGLTGFGELLAYRGSARPDSSLQSRGSSKAMFYKALAGFRYDFQNESALVVEFFRQSDGDTRTDLSNRISALRSALAQSGQFSPEGPVEAKGRSDRALSALNMQNYLFLNYQRYKISDDLLLSLSIVHNLHDASGYAGPSLVWSPTESIFITLNAQSDFRYLSDAGLSVASLKSVREIDLNPMKSRVGFELKSFF